MKVTEKNFIDPNEVLSKTKGTNKKAGLGKSPELASTKVSPDGDLASAKVKLSERAQDMKKIREHIAATPDVDEAKVQKYKSMLAKGEYKVDSNAVADKMVDEHLKNEFFVSKYKDE